MDPGGWGFGKKLKLVTIFALFFCHIGPGRLYGDFSENPKNLDFSENSNFIFFVFFVKNWPNKTPGV